MNRGHTTLVLLLTLSISLNVYLFFAIFTEKTLNSTLNLTENTEPQPITQPIIRQSDAGQRDSIKLFTNQANNKTTSGHITNREQLLEQANEWLQNKEFAALIPFLQNYLKAHPQDMAFLLIEAKMKVETELLSDAISHYYDLLRSPMTAAQQTEVEQQITKLTQTTITQLERNYSWDILAMFVEPLLQLEPTSRLYILSLATAYAQQLQAGLMENVLGALDYYDPDAQKVRQIVLAQLPAEQAATPEEQTQPPQNEVIARSIPLKQVRDQYLVSGALSGNPVNLLIDTGASITAISEQYFDQLSNRFKINHLGRFTIGTAGGSVMASIYEFRELTLHHVTVQNLPVVVLPMEGISNADGLLGMNFLREFDFKIDQKNALMFIE
ncbi:MAG: retropepsin-like aspartic protease [Paraglaciecola sp.]|uniref:retropepsin-like aspartic protease family protein n=1 Tax=Paraglaciecola sp. TaxID=1920173 RepID=UPI00326404C3